MQIVRVYTGADGESHFEDLTPEQFAQIVNNVGKGPITVNCRPSPSFSDGLGHMTVDTCGKQFLPTFHMAFKAKRNSAKAPRSSKESCSGNMVLCRG